MADARDSDPPNAELEYYREQVDRLAGDSLRLDYVVSELRHELKQKRQAFTLLVELQESILSLPEVSRVFDGAVRAVNATLNMDRTLVLLPTEQAHTYRPAHWIGYRDDAVARLRGETFLFPESFAAGGGQLLVNGSCVRTPLIEQLRSTLDLPYFIAVPVTGDIGPLGLFLSGRLREARPLFPPLDAGDLDTFRALANFIATGIRNKRIGVLEEMDRLKTEFFANISHEFRTPITLTLGPLQGWLSGRYGAFSDDVTHQAEVMLRNQERLLSLINQILDLAKLEAGRMRFMFGPMPDVNRFIRDRVEQFRPSCEARGLQLDVAPDPALDGADLFIDREQFDKLVFNLLSNAEKFTDAGGIRVSTERLVDGFALTVIDTGVGIPVDQVLYIFDRFRQAEGGAARRHGGTGLGLAWVREVARLHGGNVTVHSEQGSGSTFRVFIPFGRAHLDPTMVIESAVVGPADVRRKVLHPEQTTVVTDKSLNAAVEAAFDPARATIVYAEDNQDLREYVRGLLVSSYNVFVAVDGEDARDKIEQYRPDLVLTDEMMPRLTGRGLVEAMRATPACRTTPVIVLTARSGTQARIEGLEAGADDYVTKPFDEPELLARIRNLLRARTQERELAELNRILETRIEEQIARLRVASRIQEGLLPTAAPSVPGYDLAGRTLPAQMVGGDYFDFIMLDDRRCATCLGDVAGKGLPAALLMANLQATIRGQTLWSPSACDCMMRSNKLLFLSTDPSKYATMFYGVLNARSHYFSYSNAGHNPPIVLSAQNHTTRLTTGGTVLGLFEDSTFEEDVVHLSAGDLLVLYSDGITDAVNANDEEFGDERLTSLLAERRGESADQLAEAIINAVTLHARGMPQGDDMTVVVVKRCV
jgi:serine phosphatase RsbU (regulator of sigma subunit)/signal transduction histidine kinase